jgi:hypothetical protein
LAELVGVQQMGPPIFTGGSRVTSTEMPVPIEPVPDRDGATRATGAARGVQSS